MTFRCLLSALVVCAAPLARATVAPRVAPVKNQVGRLELGPDVTAAIQKFDPDFRAFASEDFIASVTELFAEDVPDQTPMGLVADFNGDGKPDVAVMGSSRTERVTLAALSTPTGVSVVVVDRRPLVRPADSVYPPPVDDPTVAPERERALTREKGLFEYLTLIPAAARAPRDGVKRFAHDAILMETYRSPAARVFRLVGTKFRTWRP